MRYWRIRQSLIHSFYKLQRGFYKLWEALLKISCVMFPWSNGVKSATESHRVSYILCEFREFTTGMVSGKRWYFTGTSRSRLVVSTLLIVHWWRENCGTSGVSVDSLHRRYRKAQNANHIRGHDENKTLSQFLHHSGHRGRGWRLFMCWQGYHEVLRSTLCGQDW